MYWINNGPRSPEPLSPACKSSCLLRAQVVGGPPQPGGTVPRAQHPRANAGSSVPSTPHHKPRVQGEGAPPREVIWESPLHGPPPLSTGQPRANGTVRPQGRRCAQQPPHLCPAGTLQAWRPLLAAFPSGEHATLGKNCKVLLQSMHGSGCEPGRDPTAGEAHTGLCGFGIPGPRLTGSRPELESDRGGPGPPHRPGAHQGRQAGARFTVETWHPGWVPDRSGAPGHNCRMSE